MILLDIDPNVVKPGWAPLVILVALGIVMVFLFLSMRKQFRKISVVLWPPTRRPTTHPSPRAGRRANRPDRPKPPAQRNPLALPNPHAPPSPAVPLSSDRPHGRADPVPGEPFWQRGPSGVPVGVGTWQWGDRGYWGFGRDYTSEDVEAAYVASRAAGLTLFDTAEVYGDGTSEWLLGQLIRDHQDRGTAVVATKFGALPWRAAGADRWFERWRPRSAG